MYIKLLDYLELYLDLLSLVISTIWKKPAFITKKKVDTYI